MDVIRLLPDSVANQIAAGEVIQRPASVIKELVENAADAGATDIRIYIKDAGKTLIQVVDNGRGMSETDARMAFERHATSKIRSAEDIFSLHTMGFRGEALPSICAISQVELRTRTEDAQMGTRLLINASLVESQEPCVCEKGTVISVRNLFYNLPARRKFLKSDSGELGHIMREFERMALVNNKLRISIDTGNRPIDQRPGSKLKRINNNSKGSLHI
ncbi:MAG: DNA mismatch repair endonuclease MutL, partial [Muribaculaceae bacterium]|nr:DNA mismatch repair endonuclease MutL [Muribaculaceae bacterium]